MAYQIANALITSNISRISVYYMRDKRGREEIDLNDKIKEKPNKEKREKRYSRVLRGEEVIFLTT